MNLNSAKNFLNRRGFTMLELIIIVSIILIIGTALAVWIDPVEKIGWAKDNRRFQDVMTLSNAFADYAEKHKGALPILGQVSTTPKVICNTQSGVALACDGSTEYCLQIDDSTFFTKNITSLPIDPDKTSDSDTGYYIKKDSNGFIVIGSCNYNESVVSHRLNIRATCDAYGGGYCWYTDADSVNDCDTVCADNGLTCVSMSHSVDALCLISEALNTEVYACSECNAEGSGYPPAWSDDNSCSYQVGTLNCANTSAAFPDCPCQ